MIKTNIKAEIGYTKEALISALCRELPIERHEVKQINILKRTLNLSDKKKIHYDMTVEAELSAEREAGLLKMRKKVFSSERLSFELPLVKAEVRPVVVGTGPAGLFAALALAVSGACPILLERGLPVDERKKKVELFNKLSLLDTECNIQFGEGGAGTFSDGKLKYGAKDKYKSFILEKLVEYGASPDILFSSAAHVGTDLLSEAVKKLREEIISLGGEVHFGTRLTDLITDDGKITGIRAEKNQSELRIETDTVILAAGHSARDTFEMLRQKGIILTPRPFGIGMRIEHKREYVDKMVYGNEAPEGIETASYHLVTHLKSGRSVYSFCNCPGGYVVGASSEEEGIVTNGMSEYARNGENSNAAFLVSLTPDDFGSDDPLAGLLMQRRIEKKAYRLTDSYQAPSLRMEDFLHGNKPTLFGEIKPTYPIGTQLHSPESYLPDFVTESLKEAIPEFDDWMRGFYHPDAIMTGPETRSTSPVRVERLHDFSSVGLKGLYPVGEGAGYSGGIVSSARDGLMAAEHIILTKYERI